MLNAAYVCMSPNINPLQILKVIIFINKVIELCAQQINVVK